MSTITTITLDVALKISSGPVWEIQRFSKESGCCQVIDFTHYSFFYSYPAFGSKWPGGKESQFHRVHTKCHLCGWMPERNYAGIGSIYVLNNGICDDEILIATGHQVVNGRCKKQYAHIPNTPRLSRMILLCPDCAKQYFPWQPYKIADNKPSRTEMMQLSIF